MAIQGFDYKEQVLGTGDTTAYGFDFLITDPSQIHLYIQDQLGNILADTLGNDPEWVSGVVFDPTNGGGTLTLSQLLGNQYVLTMFLANDAPDQPTDFPDKLSFNLNVLETALDYMAAWGQRIAYLAQRALRLHDLDDIDGFDMRLPMNASTFPGAMLEVNEAGNGWVFGSTESELIALAVLAAEAAIYAGGPYTGYQYAGPYTAIAPGSNLNLPNQVTDHTKSTEVDYIARIRRGTTVYARQEFSIFYRNGNWELALGGDLFANQDHGVTFTVNAGSGQINAAVANDGGSNAVIDLYKLPWIL